MSKKDKIQVLGSELEKDVIYGNPASYLAKKYFKNFLVYFLLVVQSLVILLPFYIMILTSVKNGQQLINQTEFQWFVPVKEAMQNMFKNYARAYSEIGFGRSMLNTIIVAAVSTVGTISTTILCAYAFARLNFKGRDLLFSIFLATMMVPGEIYVITNFITVSKLGWLGMENQTYFHAILCETVPHMTSIFYIYYLRQTFKQVPNELYYAAKVDGTTDFGYLFRVMVPVASGTIISITILNAMSSWNAYIWPNLVTSKDEFRLITQALRNANFRLQGGDITDVTLQMAAAFMVTVPLLVVFFCLKKHIMRGVSRSGIKG